MTMPLHTGDMARRDADGCLCLVDRAKDMVITRGFNVHASEVEACLALHPAVAQSAVIGVLHTSKQLWLMPEMPVTALAKIDKKALRARFWDARARQVG